jgi:hypothetical protein
LLLDSNSIKSNIQLEETIGDVACLPLPLLVPRIRRTDHVDAPLSADDLATFANPFDAGTHFHDWTDREKKAQRRSRETLDARGLFAARSARYPAVRSRSIAWINRQFCRHPKRSAT